MDISKDTTATLLSLLPARKMQIKKPRRNAAFLEHFYYPGCPDYLGAGACGFAAGGVGRLMGAPVDGLVVGVVRTGAATPDCVL
jgi:hypothetical protein